MHIEKTLLTLHNKRCNAHKQINMNSPKKLKCGWAGSSAPRIKQSGRKYKDDRYHTRRWRKIRKAHLDEHPFCVECEKNGIIRPARVLDHIKPVRLGGDFWDTDNHQGLCNSCHNSKSGTEAH